MQGELLPDSSATGIGIEDDVGMEDCVEIARPSFALVYERSLTKKTTPSPGLSHGSEDVVERQLFFQPVVDGRTNSYTTFLGEQIHFDWLAQPFAVKQAVIDPDQETNVLTSFMAVLDGEPLTCSVSDVDFETLSRNMYVWQAAEVGYHITKPMQPSCTAVKLCAKKLGNLRDTSESFCQ